MTMELMDVKQGSDEWLALRLSCRTASEAPVMMGESNFMSRNQLLALKKGWQSNPVDSFKARLYQKGHDFEDAARVHIEEDYFTDLPALVGKRVVDGIELLASFDGIEPPSGPLAWEHKSWNEALAENVRNALLTPLYYWQLEQQMLVAGIDKIVFTASDGTKDKRVSMTYAAVPGRAQALIDGWRQFDKDLEVFELSARIESTEVQQVKTLPAINCRVESGVVISNIKEAIPILRDMAQFEMSVILESDEDFEIKSELNKATKKLREKLKLGANSVQEAFASFNEFKENVAEADSILQKMQSAGEKQVNEQRVAKKLAIISKSQLEYMEYLNKQLKLIKPIQLLPSWYVQPDFKGATKNKRSVTGWQEAVDDELAKVKIEIDNIVIKIQFNLIAAAGYVKDYPLLFGDLNSIINQNSEGFIAIVRQRVNDHEAEEKRKTDALREKIREEEEAKAKKKVEEDAAEEKRKADAEEDKQRRADKVIADAEEAKRVREESAGAGSIPNQESTAKEDIKSDSQTVDESAAEDTSNSDTAKKDAVRKELSWSIERVATKGMTFYDEVSSWAEKYGVPGGAVDQLMVICKKHMK